MSLNIGYIVGSLSANSINRKLARNLIHLAGDEITFNEIEIANLPLYNRDQDVSYPPVAVQLKDAIQSSDGILIVTPEYNRSMPAALKNAFEWGSRPYGQNAFSGIPGGVIGASPGLPGTAMSQQHIRNVLAYLNSPVMGQPEGFINFNSAHFDETGIVRDDATKDFLTNWTGQYVTWVKSLVK